jgi:hypothetical protein
MTIQNEKDEKTMPLKALETLAVLIREERRTKSAEPPQGSPYETLAKPTREKKYTESSEKSSVDTKPGTFHIVDMTDQHVGKSLIITGAEPPEKQPIPAEPEGAPRKSIEATEESPEK